MKVEVTSSATLEQVLTDSIPFVANECADPFQAATPCFQPKPVMCLLCGKPENLTVRAGIVFTDFMKWNQLHMDCALTLPNDELVSGKYFFGGAK